ncbi:DbpA RNA binding domain-containing protein [Cyclobacterium salsum]|uniref:DbpA RNA binding domain-containing protein n=1 Tax=Cyclobacterium salsum TaxID=2666329 RepID=UPI001F1992F0|nr:DbpA RNA binding domain-containing protein [Cyclobacterium salsum]
MLGFLTKTGGLKGNEIGLISILETATYVAIPRQKVSDLLKNTSGQKLKKVKVKLEIAN